MINPDIEKTFLRKRISRKDTNHTRKTGSHGDLKATSLSLLLLGI